MQVSRLVSGGELVSGEEGRLLGLYRLRYSLGFRLALDFSSFKLSSGALLSICLLAR